MTGWIRPRVAISMHNLKTDSSALAKKVGPELKVFVLKAGATSLSNKAFWD